ncbi:MAG: elongation factor G [Planctomycetota bacterium]|jgi:elongation factor G
MALESKDIRTVALVGHSGSGKTMLAEAMLLAGGVINELGSVEKGTTVSDSSPEEKEAGRSVNLGTLYTPWKGRHVNVLDAPGYADFAGMALSALSAADLALVTVNANAGLEVTTRKMWDAAGEAGCPRGFIITRLDGDNAKFDEVLESLKSTFGASCAPVTIPKGVGKAFEGVESLVNPDGELSGDADAMRQSLMESAISSDEELMEKYLSDEEIPTESLAKAMREAVVSGDLVPVLSVVAPKGAGVDALLDFVADYAPTPSEARPDLAAAEGDEEEGEAEREEKLTPADGGPFVARIFKVLSDDYVGKVSVFRVYQGSLKAGATVHVPDVTSAKVAKLYRFQGKDQTEVATAVAGDVVATAKIEELAFGMTLLDAPSGPALAPPRIPKPMIERAVEPKSRGDEGKISSALRRLADEDPTFEWRQDPQTHETVVAGLGDRQLKIMFDRMKRRFQLEITTRPPKIAYRETITGSAEVKYRHKKQTGGAGQFAEVSIKASPNERGAGYEFVDDIFGGAIDQQFRPSVDKGIRATMAEGILAGFPVVDVKVSLFDGKTHPVDSKDIAFQIAGREAIKEAVGKAKPVLLEPIVTMEIVVPSRFMGDITGDISGRRGRIQGMDSLGDMQVVKAQVPAAEVQTYGSELQSLTGGEGYFTMEFSHYDVVPSNVAQQVIAQYAKDKDKD